MGQQQLLLIVLGVIVVGIAIVMGIFLFQQNSIEQKRDLLINEGLIVSSNAKAFYYRPKEYGGGQYSFLGWEIPAQFQSSANGSYTAEVFIDRVEITGTGNDLVSGADTVKVKFIVTGSDIETQVIN